MPTLVRGMPHARAFSLAAILQGRKQPLQGIRERSLVGIDSLFACASVSENPRGAQTRRYADQTGLIVVILQELDSIMTRLRSW
jgi:hypothetical protein